MVVHHRQRPPGPAPRLEGRPRAGRRPSAGPAGTNGAAGKGGSGTATGRRRSRQERQNNGAAAAARRPPRLRHARLAVGPVGGLRAGVGLYRIPLFLLPIYQAAGIQYGVPWQVLAAINEVETNYGNDLSVSTAGAVGWMQFMPETWLQYGVDALGAGYADPYNPVDAIFAAARYLHAAGARAT